MTGGKPEDVKITDPYEVFGFGVLAYFSLLRWLMASMAMMTVVTLPLVLIYRGSPVMDNFNDMFYTTYLSIGNLGQAEAQCVHQYVSLNYEQTFVCSKGKMTSLFYQGIIPGQQKRKKLNKNSAYCGDHKNDTDINFCSTHYLNQSEMQQAFTKTCKGQ